MDDPDSLLFSFIILFLLLLFLFHHSVTFRAYAKLWFIYDVYRIFHFHFKRLNVIFDFSVVLKIDENLHSKTKSTYNALV